MSAGARDPRAQPTPLDFECSSLPPRQVRTEQIVAEKGGEELLGAFEARFRWLRVPWLFSFIQ